MQLQALLSKQQSKLYVWLRLDNQWDNEKVGDNQFQQEKEVNPGTFEGFRLLAKLLVRHHQRRTSRSDPEPTKDVTLTPEAPFHSNLEPH